MKRLRPIADKRNIDLILDCFRPVEADVDEVKFTLAISNLVENGIKYNVDDGWVRVSLDADHKYFYVTVADSGMGIPEDSIERIFDVFTVWISPIPKKSAEQDLDWPSQEVPLPCITEQSKYSVKKGKGLLFLFAFLCLILRPRRCCCEEIDLRDFYCTVAWNPSHRMLCRGTGGSG